MVIYKFILKEKDKMKRVKKTICTALVTGALTVLFCVPAFAGMKNTKAGPVFTITSKDTVMTTSVKAGQVMTIANKVGSDLAIIENGIFVGALPNNVATQADAKFTENITVTHQLVNGMHALTIVSSAPTAPAAPAAPATPAAPAAQAASSSTAQIAAIDAQINQLCVYYQQAQATGDTNLMNQCVQLVQALNAQKAALMK